MSALILVLPFSGALISGLFGRKLGNKGSQLLTTVSILITLLLSLTLYYEVCIAGASLVLPIGHWLDLMWISIDYCLNIDSLTVSMFIPVLGISTMVHLYSIEYMEGDPHKQRFFSYLSLFTFSMLLLITSDNLLILFLGWEGLGLTSYLLINFWFTRIDSNLAALKAFLMNRVGDWSLVLLLLLILSLIGDLSISTIFALAHHLSEPVVLTITIAILIGCIAKSAQIGLHTWLPQAMAGPTPVSALIHAATMVTAGVYLLIRFSPIFEWTETSLTLVCCIGALTALFGACSGLIEYDLKAVIAYSTTSQLGYMVVAAGLSAYSVSLFHLVNHAFFKALLFLGAGSVIHALSDEQDLRKMGGLINSLPRTYAAIMLGSLSLMALPFFTGFYSKDMILEVALASGNLTSLTAYLFTLFAAIFTSMYSVRLLLFAFTGKPRYPKNFYQSISEPKWTMSIPLLLLAIASVFFGCFASEIFVGAGNTVFENSIFTLPQHNNMIDAEFLATSLKLIPLIPLIFLLSLA